MKPSRLKKLHGDKSWYNVSGQITSYKYGDPKCHGKTVIGRNDNIK